MPEIACGAYVEDTGLSEGSFYIWAVVLPLFPAAEHIHFALSRRVLSGRRFNSDELTEKVVASCRDEIVDHIAHGRTFNELVRLIKGMRSEEVTLPVWEIYSYALILAGEPIQGEAALVKLRERIAAANDAAPWVAQIDKRAVEIAERLRQNPSLSVELLEKWVTASKEALRLKV